MNPKLKKLTKYFLIFIAIIFGLLLIWFALKPLRIAKADEYLNSGTLIGYQKASVLTPFSPYVYLKIGQVYENNNNIELAEKEFKKILSICRLFAWKNKQFEVCPEYKEGYFNLKKLELKKALKNGELDKAGASLAESLELNSKDPETVFYHGVFLVIQDDFNEAKKNLEDKSIDFKAMNGEMSQQRQTLLSVLKKDISLENPYAYVLVGAGFLKMGYGGLAIIELKKATELDSEYRDAYIYLGKAYLQQSDFNKAEESLKKAAEIDPINAETYHLLSKTYQKLKNQDKADKALVKARMLGWKE
ncbi:MAG: tetratricopeptide repeat protein [Candidatus Berkelbacteria bacterium]|nr:tetratricopeptide repeat protein [Candidatus Berkelbacteria bacterium]